MVVFSSLRRQLLSSLGQKPSTIIGVLVKRQMGDHHGPRKLVIKPTEFQYKKCMNMIHLYSCIAFAIYGSIIFYCNVFIGEPELREIPDGYVPKYWEYYQHPITRWMAWMQGDPQKYYENMLHHLFHDHWDMWYTKLEKKIKFEMKKHKDYKAYYYQAIDANTLRHFKEREDHIREIFAPDERSASFPFDFKDDGNWPAKPSGSN